MNVQPDVQSADVSRKQSASAECEDVNHGAAATPMGSRERMSAPFEGEKDERVREREGKRTAELERNGRALSQRVHSATTTRRSECCIMECSTLFSNSEPLGYTPRCDIAHYRRVARYSGE